MGAYRIDLSTMTANQVSQKWVVFLKDLSCYGMDVTYEELITTGGTFDPVSDQVDGGVTTPNQQVFTKSALLTPVMISGNQQNAGQEKTGFAMGHALTDVVAGESMVCRLKVNVPITKTGTYYMMNAPWKVSALIDSYSIGARVFWNLVQFIRG